MLDHDPHSRLRRLLLNGLTATPALLWPAAAGTGARRMPPPKADAADLAADQVLNVAEFEALARAKLPPAHFGYLATGVDDDRTVFLNHDAYSHIEIRSRRFTDVSGLDNRPHDIRQSMEAAHLSLGGCPAWAPFIPRRKLGVARAAASRDIQMMLSAGASSPLEAVMARRQRARCGSSSMPTDDWRVTEAVVHRAQRAGCVPPLHSPSIRLRAAIRRHCCGRCSTTAGCAPNATPGADTICGAGRRCSRESTFHA